MTNNSKSYLVLKRYGRSLHDSGYALIEDKKTGHVYDVARIEIKNKGQTIGFLHIDIEKNGNIRLFPADGGKTKLMDVSSPIGIDYEVLFNK